MTTLRSTLLVGLILATTLGGCAAAAAPSASPPASQPPTASLDPTPTSAPPTQVPGGVDGGGNTGTSGGVVDPNPGGPTLVVPKPGTRDPRPVSVETLEAQVDGQRVTILATWWSGVEPCYTLDTVNLKRDGNDFTVALTEGHAGGDVACIEIAVQKATAIDLGELEPGDYTVTAQGSTAEPITFTVG